MASSLVQSVAEPKNVYARTTPFFVELSSLMNRLAKGRNGAQTQLGLRLTEIQREVEAKRTEYRNVPNLWDDSAGTLKDCITQVSNEPTYKAAIKANDEFWNQKENLEFCKRLHVTVNDTKIWLGSPIPTPVLALFFAVEWVLAEWERRKIETADLVEYILYLHWLIFLPGSAPLMIGAPNSNYGHNQHLEEKVVCAGEPKGPDYAWLTVGLFNRNAGRYVVARFILGTPRLRHNWQECVKVAWRGRDIHENGTPAKVVGITATDQPDDKGYIKNPADLSVYIPVSEIIAKHSSDLPFTITEKKLGLIVEQFAENGIRWTRPISKAGQPISNRRHVHLTDWLNYIKGCSQPSSDNGWGNPGKDELDAKKNDIKSKRLR